MKQFKPKDTLVCLYCGEKQEFPAIDYIPFVPNFFGRRQAMLQSGVHEERCCHCDEVFYLKLLDDGTVGMANLPAKLY